DKALLGSGTDKIVPDDLSLRIDVISDSFSAIGRINGRVDALVFEKAVFYPIAVHVKADNLSVEVNALGDGVSAARRINRLIVLRKHRQRCDKPSNRYCYHSREELRQRNTSRRFHYSPLYYPSWQGPERRKICFNEHSAPAAGACILSEMLSQR